MISVDIRATLASWGREDALVGGVAVLGATPAGAVRPVDAVILRPTGLTLVVGLDLPDPALKLDAPLAGRWRVDGWLLSRSGESPNPSHEAVELTRVVRDRLREAGTPVPSTTVIAIGPYVGEVRQPPEDVAAGFWVLHPSPPSLLGALRESAHPSTWLRVREAREVLAALFPDRPELADDALTAAQLAAEGFSISAGAGDARRGEALADRADEATVALHRPTGGGTSKSAARSGMPIPTGDAGTASPPGNVPIDSPAGRPGPGRGSPGPGTPAAGGPAGRPAVPSGQPGTVVNGWPGAMRPEPRRSAFSGRLVAAAVIAVVVLGVMAVLAVESSRDGDGAAPDDGAAPEPASVVVAEGTEFGVRGQDDAEDCARHSYGDVQAWLADHPCVALSRGLFHTEAPAEAAVSTSVVEFTDESQAQEFEGLVTDVGRGGISDLVRDGHGWRGGPESFDGAAFVVARSGTLVRIGQAVWIGKPSTPDDAELTALAETGLTLAAR
ncbi:hypothetical protein FHR81_004370 [Actinoalloteichus hoggarensis]|uniref:hypothetical protein n=1 Tax=Actinoalloteichus hoggarensis TaxID=1470176 RepID=UPI0012FE1531|nr:hypothetical protein [Actinoalloteichus hoggarensis]MBB5923303.1 hypothetical protein [Actinoalloteichus hoggarensis]